MTVADTSRKAGPFDGNGVTTSFPFDFKVFAKTDVRVVRSDLIGVESDLVLDSDYTVTLNVDQDATPGGTVFYDGPPILPTGWRLVILGSTPINQVTDITNVGRFNPDVIERTLDRTTVQIQQLEESLSRAVQVPPTSSVDPKDLLQNLTIQANEVFEARDQVVTIAATFSDQANERLDEIEAEGNAILDGFSADGTTRLNAFSASAAAQLSSNASLALQQRVDIQNDALALYGSLGYVPPVGYVAGLLMSAPNQTVSYGGDTYAPIYSELPFITSGVFEVAKFRLIQGVSGANLAAASGSLIVGFQQTGVGSVLRTVQAKLRNWIDVLDFVPVAEHAAIYAGTTTYDASTGLQQAANEALATGKGLRLEGAGLLYLGAAVDLRGVRNIDIRCKIRALAGLASPAITVGGGSVSDTYLIRFADVTDGTSVLMAPPPAVPVFRMFGLKRSEITIGSCNYLQFWADSTVAGGDSNGYNCLNLNGAQAKFEYAGNGAAGWNNENRVRGGSIQRYRIDGSNYPHNHNKLENPTFEGASVSLEFVNAWVNQVYGARFENVAASPGISFDVTSYSNTIISTWSGVGNPRAQFVVPIPVNDLGPGNLVTTESAINFRKTQVLSVSSRSNIIGNATDSVADSTTINPSGYPPFTIKAVLTPSLKGFEVVGNRIIAMSDPIPVRLGDVLTFSCDYDGSLIRPYFYVFDANMQPITSEGGSGAFIGMSGLGAFNVAGYYTFGANLPASTLNSSAVSVIRADLAYLRVSFATPPGGVFRSLGLSIFTQTLGRGVTEAAVTMHQSPRVLAGAPTKGFAPLNYTVYDSVAKRNCWNTFKLETTLAAPALIAGDLSATVVDATGVANGDIVGILLDNGATHWTSVSGLAGATFTIAAVPAGRSAAIGSPVAFNRWSYSHVVGSVAYNPPNIAAGGVAAAVAVSAPGAALGDIVTASFSLDAQGIDFSTAYVSAADVVTVVPKNPTAAAIDLAGGTLRVRVSKT